jgi:hypothetical protein
MIEIRQIEGDIPNRLDPSLLPIKPSTGDKVDSVGILSAYTVANFLLFLQRYNS